MPSYFDVVNGRAAHARCGGDIVNEDDGDTSGYGFYRRDFYRCAKCRNRWSEFRLQKFTQAEIDDRFTLKPRSSVETMVLVWDVEPITQRRFTRLVPVYSSGDKEKVKT